MCIHSDTNLDNLFESSKALFGNSQRHFKCTTAVYGRVGKENFTLSLLQNRA